MARRNYLLSIVFVLSINTAISQPCKEVVGYYPNWQWYKRSGLVNPKTIDYSKYTILNYAFFKPNSTGKVDSTDWWADENLLLGEIDWNKGGYKPNTSIIDLAHNNGVKVMVSIGGWTLSDNFSSIAADAGKRQVFASECVRLIKKFNFDGIDIDWEYPGYAEHKGTPQDKQNFTLLLQDIRAAIDAHGNSLGKKYLLSACFSADAGNGASIEWDKVKNILDMINMMTYDFNGPWNTISNHNSPLYAPEQGGTAMNVHATLTWLTQQYGISPSQVNLGVAFYGRSFASCNGLFEAHSGNPDNSLFAEDEGNPMYYNIMKSFSSFTRYWDDHAKVPYALNTSSKTFLSYDDAESIGLKADYIVKNNVRGCIIWEITGDYLEGAPGQVASTPLASKIKEVFCAIPVSVGNTDDLNEVRFSIFPNPVSESINIKSNVPVSLTIIDITGKIILEKSINAGETFIDFQDRAKGMYVCVFKDNHGNLTGKKTFVH